MLKFHDFSNVILAITPNEDDAGRITDVDRKLFQDNNVNQFIIMENNINNEDQLKSLVIDINSLCQGDVKIMIDIEGGGFDKNNVSYESIKDVFYNKVELKEYLRKQCVGVNRFAILDVNYFIEKIQNIDISTKEKFEAFVKKFEVDYFYASNRQIGEMYEQGNIDGARKLLKKKIEDISSDLNNFGFNFVCAPVADLMLDDVDNMLVQKDRLFSTCPDITLELAQMSIDIFNDNGITPIVKHIPGHGMTRTDSHYGLPYVSLSKEELDPHFKMFSDLKNVFHFMIAHIVYDSIDDKPITISVEGILYIKNNILKNRGDAILITDAIEMGALYQDDINPEKIADVSRKAFEAGADSILCCYPPASKAILAILYMMKKQINSDYKDHSHPC